MKRTLATILSLILVMIAFTACGDLFNDSDDLETVVVPPSSDGYKPGDVVLTDPFAFLPVTRTPETTIQRKHFSIGIVDASGNLHTDSSTDIGVLKVKVEINRNDGKGFVPVTLGSDTYGKVGDVIIKVTRTDDASKYATLTLTISEE